MLIRVAYIKSIKGDKIRSNKHKGFEIEIINKDDNGALIKYKTNQTSILTQNKNEIENILSALSYIKDSYIVNGKLIIL